MEIQQIKRDLHGEPVGRAGSFCCDFCDAAIAIGEPVMYDIASVDEMPNLEALVDLPDGWALDAARCRECEVDSISPETDGWEEAVVMLSINESNGVLSADTTEITVVDYSPGNEGTYPPPVPLAFFTQHGYSMSRWGFLRNFVENTDLDIEPIQLYRKRLAEMDQEER
ncbi:hypothetical protein [Halomarina pelagica]|uniref:hypothetical protein n=1 Tax=Halomarina pelagica TaxID=2961599 RepID=UPI0020C2CE0C|nr:hypothetical protein [Halomarina sp. BND7]